MKKSAIIILSIILILSTTTLASESDNTILMIETTINKDDTALIDHLTVRYGTPDKELPFEMNYKLIIYNNQGNQMQSQNFQASFAAMPDTIDSRSDKIVYFDSTIATFKLPYDPSYKQLQIKHHGKTILSTNIAELLCNKNGICDNSENYLSCRSDCKESSTDGFCEKVQDNFCDADCIDEDPDCKTTGCGNSVCDIDENHNTCPIDCPAATLDNYCESVEDQRCDPDCPTKDPDCEEYEEEKKLVPPPTSSGGVNSATIIAIIVVVGIVTFLFFLFRKVSKQKSKSYLEQPPDPDQPTQFQNQQYQTQQTSQQQYQQQYLQQPAYNQGDVQNQDPNNRNPFDKYKYMYKK
jgi:uncharacterized protein YxeA